MWPAVIIVWEIWGIFLLADIFLGGKLFNQLLFIFVLFPEIYRPVFVENYCRHMWSRLFPAGNFFRWRCCSTRRSLRQRRVVLLRESEPNFPSERITQRNCDMARRQSSHCRLLSIKNMGNCFFKIVIEEQRCDAFRFFFKFRNFLIIWNVQVPPVGLDDG